jgi:hypothetical protein
MTTPTQAQIEAARAEYCRVISEAVDNHRCVGVQDGFDAMEAALTAAAQVECKHHWERRDLGNRHAHVCVVCGKVENDAAQVGEPLGLAVGENKETYERGYRDGMAATKAGRTAAQVGEPTIQEKLRVQRISDQRLQDATIDQCIKVLIDKAKAIRSGISGGDGTEPGWIKADALDEAVADLRKLKDTP